MEALSACVSIVGHDLAGLYYWEYRPELLDWSCFPDKDLQMTCLEVIGWLPYLEAVWGKGTGPQLSLWKYPLNPLSLVPCFHSPL